MEKINKLKEKKDLTSKDILELAKKAISLGIIVSPIVGLSSGCSKDTDNKKSLTEIAQSIHRSAVIVEGDYAVIIDYDQKEYYRTMGEISTNTWRIQTTTGEVIDYTYSDKSSIMFIEDENAHELALLYAESIVGDNYIEFTSEEFRKRG